MRGIILAGGLGTRLNPLTKSVSKQLLPLFDKPMIYYPLSTLIELGIKDILLISKKEDKILFQNLLKDGSQWGLKIEYEIQDKPSGIAESFIIGEKFIKNKNVALILGDNIFYGVNYNIKNFIDGAVIFSYQVQDPQRYGVIEIKHNLPKKIVEKPKIPKSNHAVTGLYIYDKDVVEIAKTIKPSNRGELEITDINNSYLKRKKLQVFNLKKGSMWLDAGTFTTLLQAAHFIQTLQERQNIQIGSPESSSFYKNFITKKDLKKIIKNSPQNEYYNHLIKLI